MTRYFEVVKRDGPARIGRLLLEKRVETPYILRSDLLEKGEGDLPELIRGSVIPWDISQDELPEGDLFTLRSAKLLARDSKRLVRVITGIREVIPPDTALYTPALATPTNLALLVYLGVDIVDDIIPTIRSYQGVYLTRDGEIAISRLKSPLCSCEICSNHSIDEMRDDTSCKLLLSHNLATFNEELRVIYHRIENGMIREYVEYKCRLEPYLTEALRLLDAGSSYLERRTPAGRRTPLIVSSIESLDRIEVRRFIERVRVRYTPHSGVLLLLPCSRRKPYSISKTHRTIIDVRRKRRAGLHEVILTSPLALVPRELELVYPAAHYDTPVTGRWFEEELNLVRRALASLLDRGSYTDMIVHVGGDLMDLCREVGELFGLDVHVTVKDRSELSHESLESLRSKVFELVSPGSPPILTRYDIISDTLDYQFGPGAGRLFLREDAEIKGRVQSCSIYERGGRVLLGRMIPDYGFIALTPEGAERIRDHGSYQVKIGDFVPKGSILAPGVISADHGIRPGDEVIILGDGLIGTGKAVMSGWEMERATRGVAVMVRSVKEVY